MFWRIWQLWTTRRMVAARLVWAKYRKYKMRTWVILSSYKLSFKSSLKSSSTSSIIWWWFQLREHPAEDIQRLSLHEGMSMLLVIVDVILIIILVIVVIIIAIQIMMPIAGLWRLPGLPPSPKSPARDKFKVWSYVQVHRGIIINNNISIIRIIFSQIRITMIVKTVMVI